jgi:hypothetical protein
VSTRITTPPDLTRTLAALAAYVEHTREFVTRLTR